MGPDIFLEALVTLLPVIVFPTVLLYLGSFKLVRFKFAIWVVLAGACAVTISRRPVKRSEPPGDGHLSPPPV